MPEPKYKLAIYNTLTREKEEFVPIKPGEVGMYTCGPTVYNYQHIGNMRTYIFEDVLRRVLLYDGYNVEHVMNITDVGHLTSDADEGEDKMIKAMRREGKTPWDIAKFYTDFFLKDLDRLNVMRASVICPATEHIQEMIDLVQCLFDKGHAYLISDGVYFDIATFPAYGHLSRQSLESNEAGARVEVNAEKHNPADFALWKIANPSHAMQWDSPWGRGYPGWHIECSAMSMKYLGETFDIHCGGVDHIPVHHENEIAQSEGCTDKPFVRYWVHGEFLLTNNQKMSKSAGQAGEKRDMGEGIEPLNQGGGGFFTLQTLVDSGIDPMAYRYFCFSAKYRAQLNYTDEAMQASAKALSNLYDSVVRAVRAQEAGSANETNQDGHEWQQPYSDKFAASINDDLNMPGALAAMHELIAEANRREQPAAILPMLYDWDRVLGLRLRERAEERLSEKLEPELQQLIDDRQAARKARDFARADALRAQLREAGVEIEDTSGGIRWKRVVTA
ncbi:MAG: cysteine--tRNA ligase [Chloroflexota bacterium]|nr:cysteine--tRNA ligase [Chloroflexota bacterium]